MQNMSNNDTVNVDFDIHQLQIVDYLLLVITLAISVIIGLYYAFTGGKQKTVQEYFLGNRKMGVIPIAMSLFATRMSAIGIVAVPAELFMYNAGLAYAGITTFVTLPVAATCYLPVFYELQLTSAYEYLELRFNKYLRKIGSAIWIISMFIYISSMLYAPSLALSQVTGLNLWASVITIGLLGTIYTALGGIRAVMWTDVFQINVLLIGLTITVIKGIIDVGGFAYVFEKGLAGGRLNLSLEPDIRIRYTVWMVAIGEFFIWLNSYGVEQMFIQRYVSSPTLGKAKLTIFLNVLASGIFHLLGLLGGLVIYAKYWNCDPITTKMVKASDQLLPLFVIETLHMYPGLTGLFIAGLFCGSLSTISSALNSMAAIVFEDFIRAFKRWENLSSQRAATVSKILTAFIGMLCLALIPLFASGTSIIKTHSYNTHTFMGIGFALFSLGLFVPWANSIGATIGIVVGIVFSQWMSINAQMHEPFTQRSNISVEGCSSLNFTFFNSSNNYTDNLLTPKNNGLDIFPLYQVSFRWIAAFSAIPVFIVGTIASALYKPTKLKDLDTKLLSPPIRYIVKKFFMGKKINLPDELNDGIQLDNLLSQAEDNNTTAI